MRLVVIATALVVAVFTAISVTEATAKADDPSLPVTPVSVAPGQDISGSTVNGDGSVVTYDLGTDVISGQSQAVSTQAPTGCARTHFNVTYWFGVTEWTMSHAVQGCYSNYKIQSVQENAVYMIDTCCGWSWTGMQFHYRNPDLLPASPVQFTAQGGFQHCVGPICITSRHPGSMIQINGNWIVTGYNWWLG